MSDNGSDFRIPDPDESSGTGVAQEGGQDVPAGSEAEGGALDGLLHTGVATTDLIIAGVAILGWFGLVLLPRKALISSLTGQFADYAKAKMAGNALYSMLTVAGVAVAAGLLIDNWLSARFLAPVGAAVGALFLVFVFAFRGALASRVRRS